MESISKFITRKLKLKVNQSKSKVGRSMSIVDCGDICGEMLTAV